jgi:hypothetical protein
MEPSNTNKFSGMAERTKIRILRSGTYVWKCLGSMQWSVRVTPAATGQLSCLPLLPLGTVSAARAVHV